MSAVSALTSSADGAMLAAQATAAQGPKLSAGMSKAQILASAKDFEAVFATQLLNHMYEGMEVNKEFGGGRGEEMFRTVLMDEYGKQMAKNDSLGIVKQVSDTLLKAQEGHA